MTLLAWWWSVRSTDKQPESLADGRQTNEAQAWRRLKSASQQADAAVYSAAVLHWARARWPGRSVLNLPSIGKLLGSDVVSDDMQKLDEMRFSVQHGSNYADAPSLRDIQHQLEVAVKNGTQAQPIASANALPQL